MIVRTVRLSSKGQLSIPAEALAALRAKRGTEFLLIQEGERLVLVKAETVAKQAVQELGGWEALAAPAFAELWDNPEDEAWDAV